MSESEYRSLPDEVYGSADTNPSDNRRMRVSVTTSKYTGTALLHAHIGGIYLAMTERNWRALFNALSNLEIEVAGPTYRITFNDETREANIETIA